MAPRPPLITMMARAVEKAGRNLVRDFGEVENLQVSRKGPADFVSAADIRAQEILHEELRRARPDFAFMMEEGNQEARAPSAKTRWIIDPLDGTTNFLHGIPHWAISIGVEEKGEIIAGVVYEPVRDELFWTAKGAGAFMNSRRLRVSGRSDLSTALMVTGIPFKGSGDDPQVFVRQLAGMMAETSGVRRSGSAALDLAYVAAGRYEGYWELSISPWDVAAGLLLVREAGGFVRALSPQGLILDAAAPNGNPLFSAGIMATNSLLEARITEILQQAAQHNTAGKIATAV